MTDLRQSSNYGYFMEKIGWQVVRLQVSGYKLQVFVKKLPLIGSIIKIQRPEKIPFAQLDRLGKKRRALFIKIEPKQSDNETMKQLDNHGYKLSGSPLLPTKTLQIDLTPDEQQVFAQFKKDARYEIRKAQKNKIVVKKSNEIEAFVNLWHKNAWARGFWIPIKKQIQVLYETFGKDAYLIMAYYFNDINHCSKPLAGALVLIHDKVAYYFHAASTSEGRRSSAPYLLVWYAIKEAKRVGCQIFDFEGIYDKRFPIKSWQGFTHFKKSFGGEEIEYPGCFVKFYNTLIKPLLRF